MTNYHAHIYFKHDDLDLMEIFFRKCQGQKVIFRTHKQYSLEVGPHTSPMIELHFNSVTHGLVLAWLEVNRGETSVLVHEDTGDDVRDHTEGKIWLGTPLPIDFSFFERLQLGQVKAVHQN
jgi:aromatic ring-cleaving dioxygenase